MFCLDWLQAGRATRGKPRPERPGRRSWPLLGLLASLAVLQSGCQSGPFSNCGGGSGLFGPCGFFSRVRLGCSTGPTAPPIAVNREWSPARRSSMRRPRPC